MCGLCSTDVVGRGGLVLCWELGFLLQGGFSLCVVVVVDVCIGS